MFGWEFPPFISGGLGRACYGICKGLAANKVKVFFVLPSKNIHYKENDIELIGADEIYLSPKYRDMIKKRLPHFASKQGINLQLSPYYTSKAAMEQFKHYFQGRFGKALTSIIGFSGNYGWDLFEQVLKYSITGEILGFVLEHDIIHTHDWLTVLAGISAKRVSNKPLIVHIHATEIDRSGENYNHNIYHLEKYGMEQADSVIAVSHYTKNIIIKHYGIDPHKIKVVHNAVSREKQLSCLGIKNNIDSKIVLFLGRVTMQKGPDYFIEAANLVLQKVKNVHFVMAGSGDMMTRMITRMANLGIADRFHFTGFLSKIDVERMYAISDLYVMPSVSEPFGLTACEALLYDVPIIISKQSGVLEILKHAVSIDFWDVQKLAHTIIKILKNKKYAHSIIEKCKDDMKGIGWNNTGTKLKQIYESVLS